MKNIQSIVQKDKELWINGEKNGIFKCYKSEQMHKPIYYPVESKTNGYIDYNDVEKILTIEDLYQENQELKLELSGYRQAILEDKDMLGLKEESEELKKQLEVGEEQYNDLVEEKESLQEQLSSNTLQLEELKEQVSKGLYNTCLPYSTGYNKAIKDKENQQKEFIEYMNKTIEELECDDVDDEEMKGYLIQRIDTFKEIFSKYKEITGGR